MDAENMEVRNNKTAHRYEIIVGDAVAEITYHLRENRLSLNHTGVPKALSGQGIATKLARFALDDARQHGYKVVPRCHFVAGYIQAHPEYQDLVAAG